MLDSELWKCLEIYLSSQNKSIIFKYEKTVAKGDVFDNTMHARYEFWKLVQILTPRSIALYDEKTVTLNQQQMEGVSPKRMTWY